MSFSSTKVEEEAAAGTQSLDLMMPIKVYWELVDLLKQAGYLMASQEHQADIQEIYRHIFKLSAPYALLESDRMWLLKRSQNQPTNTSPQGGSPASS